MNKALVIGGVALGGLLLVAATGSAKEHEVYDYKHEAFRQVHGFPGGWDTFKTALSSKLPKDQSYNPGAALYDHWQFAKADFVKRRALLPANAHGTQDAYTKERYILPSQIGGMPTFGSIDEFGRPPAGLPQNFGATALAIAQQVAPLIPGFGTAASAALGYAIAIGQGKSQQDALLAAGRAAIPPQYRYAFDMAVGIASGQSVPEAAKNALFAKYPGAKQAYEKGAALAPIVRTFT